MTLRPFAVLVLLFKCGLRFLRKQFSLLHGTWNTGYDPSPWHINKAFNNWSWLISDAFKERSQSKEGNKKTRGPRKREVERISFCCLFSSLRSNLHPQLDALRVPDILTIKILFLKCREVSVPGKSMTPAKCQHLLHLPCHVELVLSLTFPVNWAKPPTPPGHHRCRTVHKAPISCDSSVSRFCPFYIALSPNPFHLYCHFHAIPDISGQICT